MARGVELFFAVLQNYLILPSGDAVETYFTFGMTFLAALQIFEEGPGWGVLECEELGSMGEWENVMNLRSTRALFSACIRAVDGDVALAGEHRFDGVGISWCNHGESSSENDEC